MEYKDQKYNLSKAEVESILSEKTIIVCPHGENTILFTHNTELFIRVIIKELAPISRKRLLDKADYIISEFLKRGGLIIEKNTAEMDLFRGLLIHYIERINTEKDPFIEESKYEHELSSIDIYDEV